MHRLFRCFAISMVSALLAACASAPPPDLQSPGPLTRQMVAERVSAVVVTSEKDLKSWVGQRFAVSSSPQDADGGSAVPITDDGYFLTADHVLARMAGRYIYVIHGQRGRLVPSHARVVWRSEKADLALLHIPAKTPYFYRWTPAHAWIPTGTQIIHGGIATGFRSGVGKMTSDLPPEGPLTGHRKFKIDIPLQPGDSGGAVVNAYGELIGINSAVEYLVPLETAFFVDSEANRPSLSRLEALIAADRRQNR